MKKNTKTVDTDAADFQAACVKFKAAVVKVLRGYNAKAEKDYDAYILNTPAGDLSVEVRGSSIFQRFTDAQAGRLYSGWSNEFSGLWNYHESNEEVLKTPEKAMLAWQHDIDQLMSIPYGWEDFKVRLERWLEAGKCPSGYCPIPGTTLCERIG
jgi:hypothetical protein